MDEYHQPGSTSSRFSLWDWLASMPQRYQRVTGSQSYIAQIDGMRFIAIMVVVVYHCALRGNRVYFPELKPSEGAFSWFPNGAAGVELFFFISGYIIAHPFFSGRPPGLGRFYKRRLFRLEPPYFLVVALTFLVISLSGYAPSDAGSAFDKGQSTVLQSFLASLVYGNGLIFAAPPKLNPPLWSLEIEIQFYLVAPFLFQLSNRLTRGTQRRAVGLMVVAAGIAAQALLADQPRWNYTLLCHFWGFWLGVVMSDAAVERDPFSQPGSAAFDILGFAALLSFIGSSMFFYHAPGRLDLIASLSWRAASILGIYYGAVRGIAFKKLLGSGWIALIGGGCYSLYLIHVPVIQIAAKIVFRIVHPASMETAWAIAVVTLVPVATVAGLVFYITVERFFMQNDWPERVRRVLRGKQSAP